MEDGPECADGSGKPWLHHYPANGPKRLSQSSVGSAVAHSKACLDLKDATLTNNKVLTSSLEQPGVLLQQMDPSSLTMKHTSNPTIPGSEGTLASYEAADQCDDTHYEFVEMTNKISPTKSLSMSQWFVCINKRCNIMCK